MVCVAGEDNGERGEDHGLQHKDAADGLGNAGVAPWDGDPFQLGGEEDKGLDACQPQAVLDN